jgi:prepilin-type N-terminal cleavage/methylation domain-containing protein
MSSGYTLVEVALALVVAALLLGIAHPHFTAVKQEIVVESAAQSLAAAHRRARTLAITRGHTAVLSVAEGRLHIAVSGTAEPQWSAPGPVAQGVTLGGAPRDLTFSPLGLTTGLSNASFHLSLGTAHRTVVMSRLGRVRILRGP